MEHKKAWGWNIPTFLELFCFQWCCLYYSDSIMTIQKNTGKTIATPPETGVPTGPDSGTVEHAPIRPQGVAIVGIYPCGKARKRRTGSGAD